MKWSNSKTILRLVVREPVRSHKRYACGIRIRGILDKRSETEETEQRPVSKFRVDSSKKVALLSALFCCLGRPAWLLRYRDKANALPTKL
ncbi:hypothetical protein PILCRDRAFT_336001 [Piloderma croceum F 1598]|uniref:Uncharacterized protein n=1 Tax=Piloderma croceum (strain F 1598) TaxID=765440 RepID=A0A0C3G6A2_PILCF|nr:hypothetical protein PILCRDRAFT_336001 [Piloderma croceum F 1598]